jgi:1-acyl-sn-glycerol-3-phosphate acyltransferase
MDGNLPPQRRPPTRWRPPRLWRVLQLIARLVVGVTARLRVTGDVPDALRDGPLILAANHLNPFDPIVLAAACRTRGVAPRIMATGGLFRAPLVGTVMRYCGHIRVDRRTATVRRALDDAVEAVTAGAVVLVYPEGRMGLDPRMWPERGKTGTARLALTTGTTVVPVAHWGTHEILPYSAPRRMPRPILRALRRRPLIRVHFGAPVPLADLAPQTAGAAVAATDRIIEAITTTLAPLRADEPDLPRYVDPTRPVEGTRVYVPRRRSPSAALAQVDQDRLAGGPDPEQLAGRGDAPVGGA